MPNTWSFMFFTFCKICFFIVFIRGMFSFDIPIEVFPKLRSLDPVIIISSFLLIFGVLFLIGIFAHGIKNYIRILKIKNNKIPYTELSCKFIEAKPIWNYSDENEGYIGGREGIVKGIDQKIYKQIQYKKFSSEKELQEYVRVYITNEKNIIVRKDLQNQNLYYIVFPPIQDVVHNEQESNGERGNRDLSIVGNISFFGLPTKKYLSVNYGLLTGILGRGGDRDLSLLRNVRFFGLPAKKYLSIIPWLLAGTLGIESIFLGMYHIDNIMTKELVLLVVVGLCLILLSAISIRKIYTAD